MISDTCRFKESFWKELMIYKMYIGFVWVDLRFMKKKISEVI